MRQTCIPLISVEQGLTSASCIPRPPLPTRAFGRPAASTTEDEGLPEALTKLAAAAPGIGEDQSPAATLRARARAVLLVQKACHAIHQDCADVMPGSVQLLLLAILQVPRQLPTSPKLRELIAMREPPLALLVW